MLDPKKKPLEDDADDGVVNKHGGRIIYLNNEGIRKRKRVPAHEAGHTLNLYHTDLKRWNFWSRKNPHYDERFDKKRKGETDNEYYDRTAKAGGDNLMASTVGEGLTTEQVEFIISNILNDKVNKGGNKPKTKPKADTNQEPKAEKRTSRPRID